MWKTCLLTSHRQLWPNCQPPQASELWGHLKLQCDDWLSFGVDTFDTENSSETFDYEDFLCNQTNGLWSMICHCCSWDVLVCFVWCVLRTRHDPCDSPSPLSVSQIAFPCVCSPLSLPPLIVPTLIPPDHFSHSPLFPVGATVRTLPPPGTTCRSPAHLLLLGKPFPEKDVRHWQCSDISSFDFHFTFIGLTPDLCDVFVEPSGWWFGLLAVPSARAVVTVRLAAGSKQKAGSPSRTHLRRYSNTSNTPTQPIVMQLRNVQHFVYSDTSSTLTYNFMYFNI